MSGSRTLTGPGVLLASPAPVFAQFTATGENGQTISITTPSSLNMTGPGTLPVIINHNAAGLITLASGAYSFRVGGSFVMSSTTPSGT